MLIDRERLAGTFTRLCETDSPSWQEGKIAALLKTIFAGLGADEIIEDNSALQTGSDSGNLIIRFHGTGEGEGIFLNCHMDTVEPGSGVRVERNGDIFTSRGETILGSDDKSGIAAIIEAIHCIRENNLPHPPFEIILTTCEEVGLLGAKSLDPTMIKSEMGYSLDSTGFGLIITGAPAANHLEIRIRGAAAHAGLHPEWGISAIQLAATALTGVSHGRIDEETTVNFGTIRGGTATNIIPEHVEITGEVRSHSPEKLELLTGLIQDAFTRSVEEWQDKTGEARGRPELSFQAKPDFPIMKLNPEDPVVRRIEKAARSIGINIESKIAGGGSDANILNGYGLPTAIIATGMTNVHSTKEEIHLQDMADLSRLILALISPDSRQTVEHKV
ncbi:MAG: M20/M25/M40 family metallo-hydrolase [Desulfobulbaceae bacterium]|nr:M20/M25/M40 family metallo-hydrolase [Desulfobulbaceae bacterium]